MKKRYVVLIFVGLACMLSTTLWLHSQAKEIALDLRFYPMVGQTPLLFNATSYPNPGGQGRFVIGDFQLFISNLKLTGTDTAFVVPDSYHLVRFDSAQGYYTLTVQVPANVAYQSIELGIGVDKSANGTIKLSGDLDPNSRMAWSWDVGYKFVLVEGKLALNGTQYPLVYHVGFDENYSTTQIAITGSEKTRSGSVINFKVDLLQLFGGAEPIDMRQLNTVKFERIDARRIAKRFPDLISLCDEECTP